MQQENNSLHWKQKLEDTERLSASHPLNKSIAWSRLQQRLKEKPKRRKKAGYWVAAACLLPLLFWLLLPKHQPGNHVVNNSNQSPARSASPVTKETPGQKELTVKKAVPAVIKQKSKADRYEFMPDESKAELSKPSFDSAQSLSAIATIGNTDSNTDSNTAKSITSTSTITKLKVVHINELNEPAEIAPVLTHTISGHPFPFQIARGEVHGNDVKTIHTTSFISLQTKPLTN